MASLLLWTHVLESQKTHILRLNRNSATQYETDKFCRLPNKVLTSTETSTLIFRRTFGQPISSSVENNRCLRELNSKVNASCNSPHQNIYMILKILHKQTLTSTSTVYDEKIFHRQKVKARQRVIENKRHNLKMVILIG